MTRNMSRLGAAAFIAIIGFLSIFYFMGCAVAALANSKDQK